MARGSEASSNLVRRDGLAAALGGALWTASALMTASKPRGCIADECEFRTMRETGALAMLGFNDQNWQALMAIPSGIEWTAVGYALWSSMGELSERPVRVR